MTIKNYQRSTSESGAVFLLLFLVCIGCVANCVWSLFDGYLMVSSSFFLLMWYVLMLFHRFCLGDVFVLFLMFLKLWLKSLWLVTFSDRFTSSQHKHANPTSRSDQSYPLTLATNLVEPEFLSLRSLSGNITCKSGTMNHGETMINPWPTHH